MFACSWIRVTGWTETTWLSDSLRSRQNPQIVSMHTSAWVKQTLLNHLLLISAPHGSEDDHDPGRSSALRCCDSSYPRGIWAGREKPFLVIALCLRGRPDVWPWSDHHPLRADPTEYPRQPLLLQRCSPLRLRILGAEWGRHTLKENRVRWHLTLKASARAVGDLKLLLTGSDGPGRGGALPPAWLQT